MHDNFSWCSPDLSGNQLRARLCYGTEGLSQVKIFFKKIKSKECCFEK